jgi:hypothetical protein
MRICRKANCAHIPVNIRRSIIIGFAKAFSPPDIPIDFVSYAILHERAENVPVTSPKKKVSCNKTMNECNNKKAYKSKYPSNPVTSHSMFIVFMLLLNFHWIRSLERKINGRFRTMGGYANTLDYLVV